MSKAKSSTKKSTATKSAAKAKKPAAKKSAAKKATTAKAKKSAAKKATTAKAPPVIVDVSAGRKAPNPDAITFERARDNWDAIRDSEGKNGNKALLQAGHALLDFDTLWAFQYTVMSCNNVDTLLAVYKNVMGKTLNLDDAAKKAGKERSADNDLRFAKEQLYVRGSVEHVSKVEQRAKGVTESTLEKFNTRMSVPYGQVKHVGKAGELKKGFCQKVNRSSSNAKTGTPTILGVRENASGADFCRELVKKGKMTKREMATFLGSNTGNYIKRLGGWGSIIVEAPKTDATPDNTIIKPNPAWKGDRA